ncbi:MAG: flagellar hook-length control protein FliK [Candidatus Eisenbacteria bacterium]|uniref:Flagellar hook-length control protein FliK n=1 Tax=Eiseniibacteriota bacterium TaxID=2212470 RepID=A0A948S1M0_UNCEI|nr:flagellar hook-length control protein FliK [Candidatus Eisenbacteria bacterium]
MKSDFGEPSEFHLMWSAYSTMESRLQSKVEGGDETSPAQGEEGFASAPSPKEAKTVHPPLENVAVTPPSVNAGSSKAETPPIQGEETIAKDAIVKEADGWKEAMVKEIDGGKETEVMDKTDPARDLQKGDRAQRLSSGAPPTITHQAVEAKHPSEAAALDAEKGLEPEWTQAPQGKGSELPDASNGRDNPSNASGGFGGQRRNGQPAVVPGQEVESITGSTRRNSVPVDPQLENSTTNSKTGITTTGTTETAADGIPMMFSAPGAQVVAAAETESIWVPNTEPEIFTEQVGQVVRLAIRNGRQEINIRLRPPEWGTLNIRIRTEGNRVDLTVQSDHSRVIQLLQDGRQGLEKALQQSGFELGHFLVGSGEERTAFDRAFQGPVPGEERAADVSATETAEPAETLTGIERRLPGGRINLLV